jgi:hypothetical protein
MHIVKVNYVKNIETALKEYLKMGYQLWRSALASRKSEVIKRFDATNLRRKD